MEMDRDPAEVAALLANANRRARLLAQAQGTWSWTDVASLAGPICIALYLVLKAEAESSSGILGLVLLLAAIGTWQLRKLRARVEALTKLLTEIEHPRDA